MTTDTRPEAPQVLFHGTTIDALVSCMIQGTIDSGFDARDGDGVSLTESHAVAAGFSANNELAFDDTLRDYYSIRKDGEDRRGAVLVLRRSALGDLTKVDEHGGDLEREWRTAGPILDMAGAIIGIEVDGTEIEWYRRIIGEMEEIDGDRSTQNRFQGLAALAAFDVVPRPERRSDIAVTHVGTSP